MHRLLNPAFCNRLRLFRRHRDRGAGQLREELSPHLLHDIGLLDTRPTRRRN